MAKLAVDPATGEIIQTAVMVKADKAPAIVLDINEVKTFHQDPEKLVDKVREQAGFAVFDVSTEKGRAECRSHAANIIRCISPAINASKALAEEAKRVVKQDLEFRKVFEHGVREIAAFHRKPLDEYEAEQERIKEEARLADEARLAEEQYLRDWQDAIDYDELFTLRKAKEEADRKEAEARRIAEENERLERELAARMEAERVRIQEEAEVRARAEQERKLEAERARIRAEEEEKVRAAAAEERRITEERRKVEEKVRADLEAGRKRIQAERDAEAAKKTPVVDTKAQQVIQNFQDEGFEIESASVTETITIPLAEFNRLVRDSELLEALKFAGVDNWDGYSDAVSMLAESE
jgi:colicin import membrane protein